MGAPRTVEAQERLDRLRRAFADHLAAVMKVRGVRTQGELARRAGIAEGVLSKMLNGKQLPDLEHLAQLAVGLNFPAAELIPPDIEAALIVSSSHHHKPTK